MSPNAIYFKPMLCGNYFGQTLDDDHCVHVFEHASDVIGIGSSGEVVEAFSLLHLQILVIIVACTEFPVIRRFARYVEEEFANEAPCLEVLVLRVSVFGRHRELTVFGKILLHLSPSLDFLFENILLVEKQDEARVNQKLAVPHILE